MLPRIFRNFIIDAPRAKTMNFLGAPSERVAGRADERRGDPRRADVARSIANHSLTGNFFFTAIAFSS
jgi:hypothetical protein